MQVMYLLTYLLKSQLLPSMWPIVVEFRSVRRLGGERRKKEKRKKIRGKT